VALEQGASARTSVNRAVEVSIHVGLVILLVTSCLLILHPFIPIVAWGIIIAVAAHPRFLKLQRALGGRAVIAAILFTLLLLALMIVPAILLGQSLVESAQAITAKFKGGIAIIPPPPVYIESWPIIGHPLRALWELASSEPEPSDQKFRSTNQGRAPRNAFCFCGLWHDDVATPAFHRCVGRDTGKRSGRL